jgi:hypothetical protein
MFLLISLDGWFHIWYQNARLNLGVEVTSQCQKLLRKARNNPAGLRFQELCRLCGCADMRLDRTRGSHYIFRRDDPPCLLSIQKMPDGKAKAYQVRQILNLIDEIDIL